MNEFEEMRWVDRIQKLLYERLVERTDFQIRRHARQIKQRLKCGLMEAYQAIEDQLLAHNPNLEYWD